MHTLRAVDAAVSRGALAPAEDAVPPLVAPLRALSSARASRDHQVHLVGVAVVVVDREEPLTCLQHLLDGQLDHALPAGMRGGGMRS